jgi:2-keto-3-deoxy-L-rhamnonate aldolase RhmA
VRLRENATKRKLVSGGTVFGIFVPFPEPGLIELCGIAGFDFAILDMEHGAIDARDCEHLIRAGEVADVTPIVRISTAEPAAILRVLDAGAQGIMVPHVNSRADAERAVAAVRYPPLGHRGAGSQRAAAFGMRVHRRDWVQHANREMLLIAMLEEAAAMEHVRDILAVPGIDVYEIGRGDLSLSMGMPGEIAHPKVEAAVNQAVAAILDAGGMVSDTVSSAEEAKALVAHGYRMMNCTFTGTATRALRSLADDVRAQFPAR